METKTGRIGKKIGVVRTPDKISIRLTTEQRDWLDTKGNRSAYITGLIDYDIQYAPRYSEWEILETIYHNGVDGNIMINKGEIIKMKEDYILPAGTKTMRKIEKGSK